MNNRDFSGDAEAGKAGDLGPEGLYFIQATASPNGAPILAVANEISGSTTLYGIQFPAPTDVNLTAFGGTNLGIGQMTLVVVALLLGLATVMRVTRPQK